MCDHFSFMFSKLIVSLGVGKTCSRYAKTVENVTTPGAPPLLSDLMLELMICLTALMNLVMIL